MTDLDPETKARIEAEERYRVELRGRQPSSFPLGTLLGILGGFLIVGGVFLPAVSAPIVGSINLFGNGDRDGKFLVILGLIAVVFALFKNIRPWLLLPGLLAAAMTYFIYSNISSNMPSDTTGLGGLIQMQYGWIVIIAGVALTVGAAFIQD